MVCESLGETAMQQVVEKPQAARGIEVEPLVGHGGSLMLDGVPMRGDGGCDYLLVLAELARG
jgi:hypothetical protein